MISHTRPGIKYAELFEVMCNAYQSSGYGGEWHHHHQGGLSGYNTREVLLYPSNNLEVGIHQVFAWNPSIAGVKSEDTILVREGKTEILTYTGDYTYHSFECNGQSILRPAIFIRSE